MKKLLSIGVFALMTACAGVAAYWYFSPYLTLYGVATAVKAKDAAALNQVIDYPRVRESLKGQFSAQMAKKMGDPSANPLSALGSMIGMAVVNPIVDALVRPEMVMQMMKDGQVQTDKPAPAPTASQPAGEGKPQWRVEREGVDRVIAIPQKGALPEPANGVGFVFERSGFVNWKLTEIRITFADR
ncbi:MAG: hypothetical protein RI884_341 [Pseudomonadota bacterium]|jgi:hypothetical protein